MIKREKRRYLALQAVTEQALEKHSVFNAVNASVLRLFGEYGASKAGLKQISCGPENKLVTIRCSHFMLEQVRAAVAFIVEINKAPVVVRVLGVSGTLKSLAKKV